MKFKIQLFCNVLFFFVIIFVFVLKIVGQLVNKFVIVLQILGFVELQFCMMWNLKLLFMGIFIFFFDFVFVLQNWRFIFFIVRVFSIRELLVENGVLLSLCFFMILLIFGSLNVFINFCNKIVFDDIVCLLEVVIFVFSLMFIWGDKCIFGMCNIVNFCCIVIRLIVYFFIFMFFF